MCLVRCLHTCIGPSCSTVRHDQSCSLYGRAQGQYAVSNFVPNAWEAQIQLHLLMVCICRVLPDRKGGRGDIYVKLWLKRRLKHIFESLIFLSIFLVSTCLCSVLGNGRHHSDQSKTQNTWSGTIFSSLPPNSLGELLKSVFNIHCL